MPTSILIFFIIIARFAVLTKRIKMADWRSMALVLIIIGFELDIFAIANYPYVGNEKSVEAMEICGFLSYCVAVILILSIKHGDLSANRCALICLVAFSFAAGN